LSSLLIQRGIHTFEQAKKFFRPSLDDLHDPFLLKDMDIAVSRIEKAIANNENILIYGDYDVDGTTAVSLVSSYLKTITNKSLLTYLIGIMKGTESQPKELILQLIIIFRLL